MKKKSKKLKNPTAKAKRIARQDALPGMENSKIAAIENAALNYAEKRDERQALTTDEVELKKKLIELMHKEGKTEYKRGNISVTLVNEKESVKVRVASQNEPEDEARGGCRGKCRSSRIVPFPETIDALKAAGYRFDSDGICRGCGTSIEWWITPRGKRMPMDVDQSGNVESHFSTCPQAKEFRK
jgi:hypothetical protein